MCVYRSLDSWVLFLFLLLLCSPMMCINNRAHYGLVVVFVCLHNTLLHYHYRCIWRSWTSKMLVKYIMSCVHQIKSILTVIFHAIYEAVCAISLQIDLTMIVIIQVLHLIIIIKSDVWPICHCLGLGHDTMVCSACLSIFLLKKVHECTLNTSTPLWQLINPPQSQSRGRCYIIMSKSWINL